MPISNHAVYDKSGNLENIEFLLKLDKRKPDRHPKTKYSLKLNPPPVRLNGTITYPGYVQGENKDHFIASMATPGDVRRMLGRTTVGSQKEYTRPPIRRDPYRSGRKISYIEPDTVVGQINYTIGTIPQMSSDNKESPADVVARLAAKLIDLMSYREWGKIKVMSDVIRAKRSFDVPYICDTMLDIVRETVSEEYLASTLATCRTDQTEVAVTLAKTLMYYYDSEDIHTGQSEEKLKGQLPAPIEKKKKKKKKLKRSMVYSDEVLSKEGLNLKGVVSNVAKKIKAKMLAGDWEMIKSIRETLLNRGRIDAIRLRKSIVALTKATIGEENVDDALSFIDTDRGKAAVRLCRMLVYFYEQNFIDESDKGPERRVRYKRRRVRAVRTKRPEVEYVRPASSGQGSERPRVTDRAALRRAVDLATRMTPFMEGPDWARIKNIRDRLKSRKIIDRKSIYGAAACLIRTTIGANYVAHLLMQIDPNEIEAAVLLAKVLLYHFETEVEGKSLSGKNTKKKRKKTCFDELTDIIALYKDVDKISTKIEAKRTAGTKKFITKRLKPTECGVGQKPGNRYKKIASINVRDVTIPTKSISKCSSSSTSRRCYACEELKFKLSCTGSFDERSTPQLPKPAVANRISNLALAHLKTIQKEMVRTIQEDDPRLLSLLREELGEGSWGKLRKLSRLNNETYTNEISLGKSRGHFWNYESKPDPKRHRAVRDRSSDKINVEASFSKDTGSEGTTLGDIDPSYYEDDTLLGRSLKGEVNSQVISGKNTKVHFEPPERVFQNERSLEFEEMESKPCVTKAPESCSQVALRHPEEAETCTEVDVLGTFFEHSKQHEFPPEDNSLGISNWDLQLGFGINFFEFFQTALKLSMISPSQNKLGLSIIPSEVMTDFEQESCDVPLTTQYSNENFHILSVRVDPIINESHLEPSGALKPNKKRSKRIKTLKLNKEASSLLRADMFNIVQLTKPIMVYEMRTNSARHSSEPFSSQNAVDLKASSVGLIKSLGASETLLAESVSLNKPAVEESSLVPFNGINFVQTVPCLDTIVTLPNVGFEVNFDNVQQGGFGCSEPKTGSQPMVPSNFLSWFGSLFVLPSSDFCTSSQVEVQLATDSPTFYCSSLLVDNPAFRAQIFIAVSGVRRDVEEKENVISLKDVLEARTEKAIVDPQLGIGVNELHQSSGNWNFCAIIQMFGTLTLALGSVAWACMKMWST